jgi:ACS family hexuronate transporter-like MFS transporter
MPAAKVIRSWAPTVSMTIVSLVSYVDRNTLALLAPTILGELHLSAEQYGWMISCFSVAYTVGNPLWGIVIDRLGLRVGMLLAVAIWTAASASHALVGSFVGFALARGLLGFGEGATFPGGLRTVAQTLPASLRARGIAIAYSGGSLGAILTPILITPIAIAYGWRGAFIATGVLGTLWLGLWTGVSRALPPAPAETSTARVRATDPRVWAFIAIYALGALPLGFVLYGAPLYLHGALGQSQASLGKLLWLPPVGWEIGYFFWGFWTDRLSKAGEAKSALPALMVALTLLSLPLAAVPALPGVALPLAVFVLATFAASGFVIVALAYAGRVFTLRDSGLIAGTGAGSWSAVVAVSMPYFGHLFDRRAYPTAFALAASVPIAGLLVWGAIHRHQGEAR